MCNHRLKWPIILMHINWSRCTNDNFSFSCIWSGGKTSVERKK